MLCLNLSVSINVKLNFCCSFANRHKFFTLADSLICGNSVLTSGRDRGSNSDSRWEGCSPDEEELNNRAIDSLTELIL